MTKAQNEGIYDARTLGKGKMLTLGLQHMFAMFGATVLVPVITGLSMSATLLFAGLGTLIFHLCTKLRVPAFLGSSFAFLGGYATVVQMGMAGLVPAFYFGADTMITPFVQSVSHAFSMSACTLAMLALSCCMGLCIVLASVRMGRR